MAISFAMRVSVPPDVLVSEVGGESVILNLKSESYWGLDETGTRFWEAVISSESIQAAYEKLLEEYDVDAKLLRQDLNDLIEKLVDRGLVEVGGAELA